MNTQYPRKLRDREQELLEWVLPADKPGYRRYRELIAGMEVASGGTRGEGHLLLARAGTDLPPDSGLTPVLAFGMVEAVGETYLVTVREENGGTIEVEMVSGRGEEIPDHFEEKRRWTYSTWRPGEPSAATGQAVREVRLDAAHLLAVGRQEKRVWLHDSASGVNYLLPITTFYNELMLHKKIRDPNVALRSSLFFEQLDDYTDDDLRHALQAYNRLKPRVELAPQQPPAASGGLLASLKRLLGGIP